MSQESNLLDERVKRIVDDYLKGNHDPDVPVTTHLPPDQLRSRLDLSLPEEGCSLDDLFTTIQDYLKYSVRTGHAQFFNQLWSGFTVPGLLGDLFTSLANTSMYTYEVAPVATLMETELIKKLGNMAGFRDPEGLLLTGGSNGNLQAMMIARNKVLPGVKHEGYVQPNNLAAFVSQEAHYSFEKAANILGVGSGNVIKVKTDNTGRMLPEELETGIEESITAGKLPFFVAATAGTTVKGAFDPCDRLAPIVRKHNLWFHVDGAFGGTVLFSPKYMGLLDGLEEADSFVWNAHKLMGLPLICSLFIVKEKGCLMKTNSTSGTDYIFHDESYGGYDLGPMSLQCGRKVDALKLWLSWKYYGHKGYAERVDKFFDLAAHAEEIVNSSDHLELMAPRSSVNVCFRYLPSESVDINEFNLKLREGLACGGKSFVNYARINGDVAIRLVIANHELTSMDIDRFFENLSDTASSIIV